MKIGVVGDIHYAQYSSIIRGRGEKYSKRLEACINSINWVEELFTNIGCNLEVYLGDFFDTESLDSETLTSLSAIRWNGLHKYLIVGNHEMGKNDLEFSSAHILDLLPVFHVVDKPSIMQVDGFGDGKPFEIAFLPYTLESNRQPITEYFQPPFMNRNRIMFSHNDIAGIQMGKFVSTTGFSIDEIEDNCDLFLNGHLHNGGKISDKIYNVGILCGQNFSENAAEYEHCVFVIDTDTMKIDCYENPYSFNFYKLDYVDGKDIPLESLKPNAIISLRVNQSKAEEWRQAVTDNSSILESRIVAVPDATSDVNITESVENLSVDHLKEFYNFIIEKLGDNDVVKTELTEVCK